ILADGQQISQAVSISKNGQWPLYLSLYGGQGSLLSWITLTNGPSDQLSGLTSWIRPSFPGSQYYPAGFTNEVMVIGSSYTAPTTNLALNFTAGQVCFTGADLTEPLTNNVVLNSYDQVINNSTNPMSLTLIPSAGMFSGLFQAPGSGLTEWFAGVL